jgi:hypothetical protein
LRRASGSKQNLRWRYRSIARQAPLFAPTPWITPSLARRYASIAPGFCPWHIASSFCRLLDAGIVVSHASIKHLPLFALNVSRCASYCAHTGTAASYRTLLYQRWRCAGAILAS